MEFEKIYINTFDREQYRLIKKNNKYIIENKKSNKYGFAEFDDDILKISVGIEQPPYDYMESFHADKAIEIEIKFDDVDDVLASELYSPFWCRPFFAKQLSQLPDNTQAVLIRSGTKYTFILPVCNETFRCYISGGSQSSTLSVNVSKQCGGYTKIHGITAVITTGKKPYETIQKGYQIAVDKNLIHTRLRLEKDYPIVFDYLGWCTWNAFYHDVSEEKVIQKAKEFNDKNIPIRWMIIDDGWSPIEFKRLSGVDKKIPDTILDLCEDGTKFPRGIRHTIDNLKTKFGVKWIGIWHSFTAYWCGLKSENNLAEKCGAEILKTNSDYLIPSPYTSYQFFHKWHEYLRKSGVDFVKADTQGNIVEYLKYMQNACSMIVKAYDGFCKSANENFSGRVINCMALNGMCVYNGGDTPLTRSSDDFYPEKENGFMLHAIQNAYNSVFVSPLFYCDYDMWWSNHVSAVPSGMLRAVSGGPVYLSDKLNESEIDFILPLVEEDGRILRCDDVGLPTEDCLFTNIYSKEKILKIYNHKDDDGVVALFNLGEKELETIISADDFNGKGQYIAYAYTQQKFYVKDRITVKLPAGSSEILNFYHVNDGKIFLGDLSKYVSVASSIKRPVFVSDLTS